MLIVPQTCAKGTPANRTARGGAQPRQRPIRQTRTRSAAASRALPGSTQQLHSGGCGRCARTFAARIASHVSPHSSDRSPDGAKGDAQFGGALGLTPAAHRGPGRDGRSRVHPEAGARGPAVGSDGPVVISGHRLGGATQVGPR